MIDLNDALALSLLALLWLAGSLALHRSLRGARSRPAAIERPEPGYRRTDLRNHAVRAWPGR